LHEPLRACETIEFRPFEDDASLACDMQQVSSLEVDEQQAGPRLQADVAQCVEETVAGEIGPGDAAAAFVDADEPGFPPRWETSAPPLMASGSAWVAMKNVSAAATMRSASLLSACPRCTGGR
jgi:hypothetical protein